MVQSTIKPAWYWLRDLKNTIAIVRIRWALKEIASPQDELAGSKTVPVRMWEYEETEITLMVPKPRLDVSAVSVKTKTERYALADAIVVLVRADDELAAAMAGQRAKLYADLQISPAARIDADTVLPLRTT